MSSFTLDIEVTEALERYEKGMRSFLVNELLREKFGLEPSVKMRALEGISGRDNT